MRIDVHQHIWTEPLLDALARRSELPFIRREQGLMVLFGATERPYVIDRDAEAPARRAELVERDGFDRALICLSSPIGIETLKRQVAGELIDAHLDGALSLGEPFGVWGPLALDELDPSDVEHLLERGCVGISLPAGALESIDALGYVAPALARIQSCGAPLLIHPGPGRRPPAQAPLLSDPLWWPALTRYISEMQSAWLVFASAGRRLFPRLRVVFSMLAGLAPVHAERLLARGGPSLRARDPLLFYDTSSYGPHAIGLLEGMVGSGQLVYGSDRPVVDPGESDRYGPSIAYDAERLLARTPRRAPARRASRLERIAVFERTV